MVQLLCLSKHLLRKWSFEKDIFLKTAVAVASTPLVVAVVAAVVVEAMVEAANNGGLVVNGCVHTA